MQTRVTRLENRADDLEERLDYLSLELKKLRGRVTGAIRKEAEEPEQEPENGEEPAPARQPFTTAHLSRRFRGF